MTSKVERQITLVNVLLRASRPMDLEEIRRRVPGYSEDPIAFRRAFERDKTDLRDMGVPLDVEPVPATDPPLVGYRIDHRRHALADPGLEDDEIEALALASAMIGGRGLTGALLKLGVGIVDGAPSIEVPTDPDLALLLTAVTERRRVGFRYRDEIRRVEPHRLDLIRGRWYLSGFDLERAEMRSFRWDRVEGRLSVEEEPDAFERSETHSATVTVEPWAFEEPSDPVEVTVRFDPELAGAVRAELRDGEIARHDEDGIEVVFSVRNRDGFRSWLYQFLDRAEVVSPEGFRQEIVDHLEELARG